MFTRIAQPSLSAQLTWSPAVAILGPRQIGKTTLARSLLSSHTDAIYLDLESPQDLARLGEGPLFLQAHADQLIILDEVQNAPGLFSVLRGEIDRIRRPGRFVLLGSASFELLRQSQSLAGRLSLIDMFPLLVDEVGTDLQTIQSLWLRGGFPPSFTAVNEQASWAWREAFIRHLLNTDLPALGLNVDAASLSRFWRMLAHVHGQLFNASALANSLDVSAPTVTRWLDHMVGALLVRRLEPFHANLGKRLVKSHKVYVRDSGLLHILLGLTSVADLQGHPMTGASWEGFVIDHIAAHLPAGAFMSFYRTAAGAELDVVVESGQHIIAFEIKFSVAPKVSKGFWQSLKDIQPHKTYIVAPVQQRWPFAEGVEVIPVGDIASIFAALRV
ncbi:MAG: ATP-binding protein [Burkholderiales bacterium]|nr:ATP-binding protein [Burkholderiales bacterium]